MSSAYNSPIASGQGSATMSRADIDNQFLQGRSNDYHQDIGLNVVHKYPKAGELYKEGHIMKNWKSRWFILDIDKQVLSYYEDRTLKEHKGDLHLGHHCTIAEEPDRGGRVFVLSVTGLRKNHHQVTYLSCGSSHDRSQWRSALEEVAFGPLISIPELFPDPFRNETRLRIAYTDTNEYEKSLSSPHDPNHNRSSPKKRSSSVGQNYVVRNGTYIQPMVTNRRPMVSYETDHHHMWQHTDYFTLIAVDPDVPSRANPANCSFVQWMVCNIRNNDIDHGKELLKYLGPAPTIGSGIPT